MDLCSRSQRGALREASRKQASPRRWSRVNGWSWPLHTFQVVVWTILFILAFANFCIFIPLLPPNWNLIMYGVTGGLFCFYFVVHLLAISIDPAETNVRLKNYLEPIPTFDPSKHTRVIENQYCHLCEVTVSQKAKHCGACNKCVFDFDHHCKWLNNCVGGRNYRCFFISLISASASLLCLITILLYVFIQYSVNPEVLRTHPFYKDVPKDTWLLFLPFFPVKTKALVVLGIGVFVLLLSTFSLLLPGYLFIFHLFLMFKKLSTYEYVIQKRCQKIPKVPAGRKELSFKISMPQQEDDLSLSARRLKNAVAQRGGATAGRSAPVASHRQAVIDLYGWCSCAVSSIVQPTRGHTDSLPGAAGSEALQMSMSQWRPVHGALQLEKCKEAPPQLRCPGLHSTITTCQESSPLQESATKATVRQLERLPEKGYRHQERETQRNRRPVARVKFNLLLPDVHSGPPSSTNTFMEDSWVMPSESQAAPLLCASVLAVARMQTCHRGQGPLVAACDTYRS
ncbi:palmitoyltransferase ZDHHC11-like [Lynx rufus]|uniref:palmitoyltransferase ZDHHC11-like n=1 Tax=Lynx rufus TaxID=61384 RepID=UPI001F124E70|nr:palmitoyltransferase ZDHHC11-like [Lynx rufus]